MQVNRTSLLQMLYDEAEYNLHDDDINLGADEGDHQITHFAPPLSRLPYF